MLQAVRLTDRRKGRQIDSQEYTQEYSLTSALSLSLVSSVLRNMAALTLVMPLPIVGVAGWWHELRTHDG